MRRVHVPIGGLEVSADPEVTLVTSGLGPCIAVLAHAPARRVGGLLHFQLPAAALDPDRARREPGAFADTGLPALLDALARLGAPPGELTLRVAGGATLAPIGDGFEIGRRNYLALRKLLWRAGLLVAAEDVGGRISRTASLSVGTGAVTVASAGELLSLA